MEFDQLPDNGKPEAEPLMAAIGGGVLLAESFEGMGQELRFDPLTIVSHGDFQL